MTIKEAEARVEAAEANDAAEAKAQRAYKRAYARLSKAPASRVKEAEARVEAAQAAVEEVWQAKLDLQTEDYRKEPSDEEKQAEQDAAIVSRRKKLTGLSKANE